MKKEHDVLGSETEFLNPIIRDIVMRLESLGINLDVAVFGKLHFLTAFQELITHFPADDIRQAFDYAMLTRPLREGLEYRGPNFIYPDVLLVGFLQSVPQLSKANTLRLLKLFHRVAIDCIGQPHHLNRVPLDHLYLSCLRKFDFMQAPDKFWRYAILADLLNCLAFITPDNSIQAETQLIGTLLGVRFQENGRYNFLDRNDEHSFYLWKKKISLIRKEHVSSNLEIVLNRYLEEHYLTDLAAIYNQSPNDYEFFENSFSL